MDKLKKSIGLDEGSGTAQRQKELVSYLNLKLASLDLPTYEKADTKELDLAVDLIKNIRERNRLLHDYLCPVDKRIQDFLNRYLADACADGIPSLPNNTLILDRYGLARELSLPPDENHYVAEGIESYRIEQGVLHNPKNDRRTTKGAFHVAAGGFPVAADKLEVPAATFGKLLELALTPPPSQLELPFTSTQKKKASSFVSLLLRPVVSPEVPGFLSRKDMEIRFFAPGNNVCNLDFVETIFGNAGDPYLPGNDAGLDPEHWTGYTGCVILAPHICGLKKKELGLPHIDQATARQKHDGMCWSSEDDVYNDGHPFKVCARDESGIMVTLLADNYFGYCKKEVKTQISFAANLYGLCEEEHAGGALAIPRTNLGRQFIPDSTLVKYDHTMNDVQTVLGDTLTMHPEGYATDNTFKNLFYIPENTRFDVSTQKVSWKKGDKVESLKLLAERTFIYPSGYSVRMEKNPSANTWRLVETFAEGTLCHKPCTVSGGGKSEISKSIRDAMIFGSIFVADYKKDMNAVEEILKYDLSNRFSVPREENHVSRSILTRKRSLGSAIKLLNSSPENTSEFNAWLEKIPNRIKGLVFLLKRHYTKDWGDNWREHFGVDFINGELGHELKFDGQKMNGNYLRVGMSPEGIWRTSKLRTDFIPSSKIQWEDDISASMVVPTRVLSNLNPEYSHAKSVKIVENCEYRFFQRPDEAIVRGFDQQAESDLASPNSFISNFAPMTRNDARDIMEHSIKFNEYTEPMRTLIKKVARSEDENTYFVDSASPRIVDGVPTKNPRYLQTRPDLLNPEPKYLSETTMRLNRKIPYGEPLFTPVNAVLPGRRNNPAEPGIRPLAVFGPIHYQELPELFMEFICSLTGKSPSTTGAGTEGALTKGPFNALVPCADLNNALLSFILTGYNGFSTAAGYIGSNYKVEHDVSLLIPELWCRMTEAERNPTRMVENKFLEKLEDFDHNGKRILASRLGYRITTTFVNEYLGKIFEAPNTVFNQDMLRPELQGMENFVDGINNITETQQMIAQRYLDFGTAKGFIPPLQALIQIMATGNYEGHSIESSEVRNLFTRKSVLASDWYAERLKIKQSRKLACCRSHIDYLKNFMQFKHNAKEVESLGIGDRLNAVTGRLDYIESDQFINDHIGTIGADPII